MSVSSSSYSKSQFSFHHRHHYQFGHFDIALASRPQVPLWFWLTPPPPRGLFIKSVLNCQVCILSSCNSPPDPEPPAWRGRCHPWPPHSPAPHISKVIKTINLNKPMGSNGVNIYKFELVLFQTYKVNSFIINPGSELLKQAQPKMCHSPKVEDRIEKIITFLTHIFGKLF